MLRTVKSIWLHYYRIWTGRPSLKFSYSMHFKSWNFLEIFLVSGRVSIWFLNWFELWLKVHSEPEYSEGKSVHHVALHPEIVSQDRIFQQCRNSFWFYLVLGLVDLLRQQSLFVQKSMIWLIVPSKLLFSDICCHDLKGYSACRCIDCDHQFVGFHNISLIYYRFPPIPQHSPAASILMINKANRYIPNYYKLLLAINTKAVINHRAAINYSTTQ